jgi:sirohydrochlorin ferrochelatase
MRFAPVDAEPAAAPGFGLIVAHGSPADPPAQEAAIAALAASVAALCAFPVAGATLAAPGALAAALARAPEGAPVVLWPHFMSDGWFVSTLLPRRLAEASSRPVRRLPPLGRHPGLPWLALDRARAAAAAAGLEPSRTRLVLAAHGSPSDPRPAASARAIAAWVAAAGAFGAVETCFVDQAPFLAEGLAGPGPALCLPLFATRAGHVLDDLPEAVAEARFEGPVLDPIGLDPAVPALIAAALTEALDGARSDARTAATAG